MRSALRAIGLAGTLAVVVPAHADTPPTVWDVARDPAEAARWKIHVNVQRLLEGRLDLGPDEGRLRVEAARAMLEDADAEHSPDVRLRFDLGTVYSDLELQTRVVAVLVPALAMAPDAPASTAALEKLAYAYAKLGRTREELDVWRRFIPRIDERARALEMMNMGEAEMRIGQLDDALATFREVLRLCGDLPNFSGVPVTYALTLWDLAVALDRSGDPRGAVDTASKAMALSWRQSGGPPMPPKVVTGAMAIEDTVSVFFVPEWERDWYLALEATVEAREASDPHDAADFWKTAEQDREAYVAGASTATTPDPWLSVARRRLDEARVQESAARKRAGGAPAPRRGGP
jgi:tetratricopeptide (TPR) repeat protein